MNYFLDEHGLLAHMDGFLLKKVNKIRGLRANSLTGIPGEKETLEEEVVQVGG